MKAFSILSLLVFVVSTLVMNPVNAQAGRYKATPTRNTTTPTNIPNYQVGPTSGSISGTIYIKKTEVPNGVSTSQILTEVRNGIRAYAFVPQSLGSGLVQSTALIEDKLQVLRASVNVSVQANATFHIINYKLSGLPINKPMTVEVKTNGVPGYLFFVNPSLPNFPVAYLTTCDNEFECYNFKGTFSKVPH